MKLFQAVFIIVLISFLSVGCGSSGGGGEETGSPSNNNPDTAEDTTQNDNGGSTGEDIIFPRPANPLTVEAKLNDTNSNEAFISPDGGTVELTLTDGTKAVLEIPESALFSTTEIKITEIESINGLPFAAGFESAVYLEPEGLRFLKPVVLTIFPPNGQAVQSSTGFSFHELGKEFHLYPAKILSDSVQFELMHFSGVGSGNATGDETANQRENHPPSSDEDQANQERDQYTDEDKYYIFLLSWWSSVYSIISASETSEAIIEHAYTQYMSWYYTSMGNAVVFARLSNQVFMAEQGLARALTNAIIKSRDRCVSDSNINEVGKILRLYLWGQVRPEITKYLLLDTYDIQNLIKGCARFELEFRSQIVKKQPSIQMTTKIEAVVPIELRFSTGLMDKSLQLTGQAGSQYLKATAVLDPDCESNLTGMDDNFDVTRFEIDLNYYMSDPFTPPPPFSVSDVAIWIDPGKPEELLEMICPDAPRFYANLNEWYGGWSSLHSNELDNKRGGGYLIEDWDPGTGLDFAEKSYQRSAGDYQEETLIELRHTPQ
jgi:hypothetical protein